MPVVGKCPTVVATSNKGFVFLCAIVDSLLAGPSHYLMIHPVLVFQDEMEKVGSLKSQLRAALADRHDANQVSIYH